jgi:hypothetical protein
MPTLAELLKAEGLEITPELATKLPTLAEASDEVRGLVTTKNDLHQWKETNKPIIDAREVEIQTQKDQAAKDLSDREALAIENKDYKAQLQIQAERETIRNAELATLQEGIKLSNERTRSSKQAEGEALIAGMFGNEYRGKLYARDFVKTEIGEDDSINTEYHINGKVFKTLDELKLEMVATPDLAKEMKAPNSNGANSGGDGSGNPATKKPKDMNTQERVEFKERDPSGFKQAFNL